MPFLDSQAPRILLPPVLSLCLCTLTVCTLFAMVGCIFSRIFQHITHWLPHLVPYETVFTRQYHKYGRRHSYVFVAAVFLPFQLLRPTNYWITVHNEWQNFTYDARQLWQFLCTNHVQTRDCVGYRCSSSSNVNSIRRNRYRFNVTRATSISDT